MSQLALRLEAQYRPSPPGSTKQLISSVGELSVAIRVTLPNAAVVVARVARKMSHSLAGVVEARDDWKYMVKPSSVRVGPPSVAVPLAMPGRGVAAPQAAVTLALVAT